MSVSIMAPFWGTWGGGRGLPFLWPLGEGKNFFIRRTFIRNFRDMLKKALEMGNSLHKGSNGEPGGGLFSATFERLWKQSISY